MALSGGIRRILHLHHPAEATRGVVGLSTIVIDEDAAEAAVAEKGSAEFAEVWEKRRGTSWRGRVITATA